jgi:hypothetical protein
VKKKGFFWFPILVLMITVVIMTYIFLLPSCKKQAIRYYVVDHPPIYSLGPYYANTDQGRLFPGQTYHYQNEGPWVGSHTLLAVISGRAVFITHYPVSIPIYKRVACSIPE